MEELYQVIKERFEKLSLLTESRLTSEQSRELREEERHRCDREAGILSALRSKKTYLTLGIKNYLSMKAINPSFVFNEEGTITEESFLNDIVCLFTKFFEGFEGKFQFKIKIRSLLRPTNHHIVTDLIKYLADFSRDYTQHLFMWQAKCAKDSENTEEYERKIANSVESVEYYQSCPSSLVRPILSIKEKSIQIIKNNNMVESTSKRGYEDCETEPANKKAADLKEIYGILELQTFPLLVVFDKVNPNIDVLRLRLNELYKNSKNRNAGIKNQTLQYYNNYNIKNNPEFIPNNFANKQYLIEDRPSLSNLPFKVSLLIEKNGFSYLNVAFNEVKHTGRDEKNASPIKDKMRGSSLSSKNHKFSISAQVNSTAKSTRNDFILNSLRVLRISENFLPPLQKPKDKTTRVNSEEEHRDDIEKIFRRLSSSNTENSPNVQLTGNSIINVQQEQNNSGMIYYNEELNREGEKKKIQKRRLSEMKRHFVSEEKKSVSRSGKKKDNDEKIVEWLDKINLMKEMERKKILGLG